MAVPAEQTDTAALLQRLAGHAPIETHISLVFRGADTVYKLKKAVRLSFLDFSTLAARERFTRRELELNAPAAPALYRDVIAVTRGTDGALALGGAGTVIDWVLRMASIPEADFLPAIAARGGLTPALLDGLGDAVADYHATLPPIRGTDPTSRLRDVILGNADSALAAGLEPAAVRAWLEAILAELARQTPLLRARDEAGLVRRAHGDLHLGNLCLLGGRPTLFDALEFDEDLATIDLAYDSAFLLMDLDIRAGRPAANRVMNRILARTADWDLPALLPLFLSLRAMVRAHVEGSRLNPDRALRYLGFARSALAPAPATVVAIGGIPGTGKSTLARALAPDLGPAPGAAVLRSDEIRKRQHGAPPEQRLPKSAYSSAAGGRVFAELADATRRIAAAGHAVIADATFMDATHRAAVEAAAAKAGVPFLGLWLTAALSLLEARVAARTADASDADLSILRRTAAARADAPGWTHIDTTSADAARQAARETIRKLRLSC